VPVRTHHAKWRSIVAAAPLIAIAILVFAFAQGEHAIFRSRGVQEALLAVAALGALVSAWTAWRLGSAPATSVAQALPGRVALRGKAQALPGAAPLLSPDGAACLWFTHSQKVMHRYDASDSVRPFLLVDDSGRCVVLPAGAEIDGSSRITIAKQAKLSDPTDITGRGTAGYGTGERLLCEGDDIHVSGWLVPASAEAIELQLQTAKLNETVELPSLVIRSNDEAEFRKAMATRPASLPPVPPLPPPVALPVVAGHGAEPFVISIGSRDGEAGVYWMLTVADLLVLCAAGGMYLWLAPAA
jgi:E3 Ubiquitin ligase